MNNAPIISVEWTQERENIVDFSNRAIKGSKEKFKKKTHCTYDASCSSIIDAFITSRFTTGPIRMLEYCGMEENGELQTKSRRNLKEIVSIKNSLWNEMAGASNMLTKSMAILGNKGRPNIHWSISTWLKIRNINSNQSHFKSIGNARFGKYAEDYC